MSRWAEKSFRQQRRMVVTEDRRAVKVVFAPTADMRSLAGAKAWPSGQTYVKRWEVRSGCRHNLNDFMSVERSCSHYR
jgi:hypothetical protein